MSKKLKNVSKIKWPKPRTEAAEFGLARAAGVRCSRCGAVYHTKSWHHAGEMPSEKPGGGTYRLNMVLCPACTMIRHRQFEGELTIERPPSVFRRELTNLIHAYGERACEMDPEHRVIAVKKRGANLIVTTTENQLAAKLAKKIKSAFPPVAIQIRHTREPSDVGRVCVQFLRSGIPKRFGRGAPEVSLVRKRGEFHYTMVHRHAASPA